MTPDNKNIAIEQHKVYAFKARCRNGSSTVRRRDGLTTCHCVGRRTSPSKSKDVRASEMCHVSVILRKFVS